MGMKKVRCIVSIVVIFFLYSSQVFSVNISLAALGEVMGSGNAEIKTAFDRWLTVTGKSYPIVDGANLRSNKEVSYDEIKAMINTADHDTVKLPCNADIRSDFPRLLKLIKGHRKRLVLHSNARIFSYEGLTNHLKTDLDECVDVVVVYYLSKNQRTHDKLTRTPGSFEETRMGEQNLIKALGKERVRRFTWPACSWTCTAYLCRRACTYNWIYKSTRELWSSIFSCCNS